MESPSNSGSIHKQNVCKRINSKCQSAKAGIINKAFQNDGEMPVLLDVKCLDFSKEREYLLV